MKVYNHFFGTVPNTIAPTVPVRYWNTAVVATIATFALALLVLGFVGHLLLPSRQPFAYESTTAIRALFNAVTMGGAYAGEWGVFRETVAYSNALLARWLVTWAVSFAMAGFVAAHTLVPRSNQWVLRGGHLRVEDASAYARQVSKQLCGDEVGRRLHPDLVLPDEEWRRHILIFGKVGAGKTQIVTPIVQQILYNDEKLFLYDVKGDFTAMEDFDAAALTPKGQKVKVAKRPIIVSPYDARSYVHDIGADVHTAVQVDTFCHAFIGDDGSNNKFFTNAARMVLKGALHTLIAKYGKAWGYTDLCEQKNKTASEMAEDIFNDYRAAFPLIENAESQTTASVMSTVMACTQYIDMIAQAWPKLTKRRFSVVEWAKDDYKGRKGVIVQGGGAEGLTAAYISMLMNIAVQEIISPALKDNKFLPPNKRRSINFIFDELTTAGRLNIFPLVALGRSKGVSVIACVQSLKMLSKWYPKDEADTLPTIVGTHIVCQMQADDERKRIADLFSTHLVASKDHNPNSSVHTEGKAVVHEEQLTRDIGPRKTKNGFEVRAIVRLACADPMLLAWPGVVLPAKREGQIPAKWLTRAAAQRKERQSLPTQPDAGGQTAKQAVGLTNDEIDQLFGA